jgi:rhamnogalacturonyl hydrolase YesR
LGSVIFLMLNAHTLTRDDQYLQAAERFAEQGVKLFFAEGSPLPKASHQHEHYEAATNGDTLLMALLQLWQIRQRPDVKVQLLYCDR